MLSALPQIGAHLCDESDQADAGTYRYSDDNYEYRHVQLPKQMLKAIPKEYFDGARGTLKLLWEDEWRGLGITQVRTFGCVQT